MNKEINLALKHRAEEMLKGNYSKIFIAVILSMI